MNVLVTLNSGQGVDLGPNFTLNANIGSVIPSTATITELLNGIYVVVDDSVTEIIITSTGSCTNSLSLYLYPTTSTTTVFYKTTTTSTTIQPTTSTTSTTIQPTTSTTIQPTTSTTTIPALNFTAEGGCEHGTLGDGGGAIFNFVGGSGEYQASDVTHSSEAFALSGIFTDVTTTRAYTGLGIGTYWIALRDKNDVGNVIAHSFDVTICPTTTIAPPSTTTLAPTSSTTTAVPTSSTTSTTIPPLNFTAEGGCEHGTLGDGGGSIFNFIGGSGEYQASDVTHSSEALALSGIFTDVTTTRAYTGLGIGTYWVALRDKNDVGNVIAHSFDVTTCPTTTIAPSTTTLAPVSSTTTISPTSSTTSTTIPPVNFIAEGGCEHGTSGDGGGAIFSFTGGSGVYQASDAVHSSEALALSGVFTDVTTTRAYSSLSDGTYWVALRDKNDVTNVVAHSFDVTICPTTTIAPSTTTLAPTTSTTTAVPTTSTTTIVPTTTTIPAVNFTAEGGCEHGTSGDGGGTIFSFTGGSGVYQASDAVHSSEAFALAGVFIDVTTTYSYSSLGHGTYWVALRDKNNVLNVVAHSFDVTICPTTTIAPSTTTLAPTTSTTTAVPTSSTTSTTTAVPTTTTTASPTTSTTSTTTAVPTTSTTTAVPTTTTLAPTTSTTTAVPTTSTTTKTPTTSTTSTTTAVPTTSTTTAAPTTSTTTAIPTTSTTSTTTAVPTTSTTTAAPTTWNRHTIC